jgi:hypothetical protein
MELKTLNYFYHHGHDKFKMKLVTNHATIQDDQGRSTIYIKLDKLKSLIHNYSTENNFKPLVKTKTKTNKPNQTKTKQNIT